VSSGRTWGKTKNKQGGSLEILRAARKEIEQHNVEKINKFGGSPNSEGGGE